jgi:hypothetical protein
MMALTTFRASEGEALARGFDEVLERKWEPRAVQGAHTHPFAVEALVVQGEIWLTANDVHRQLRPGDIFALDANVMHFDRYGDEGAVYWAARRDTTGSSAQ